MKNVLETSSFTFPYTDIHFPGQNSGEKILFVTRESPVMQKIRISLLAVSMVFLVIIGGILINVIASFIPAVMIAQPTLLVLAACVFLLGGWWMGETYKKSVFIITTRRLTKIIYTTPFTWYQFSLGLDEIADTGSYSSTYFEAIFHLGYFVARSGAAAIKNFKIVNITFAADLHNYVNKLLYAFKHHPEKINDFRPFIPFLKGEKRKAFLKEYSEYKTEF